MKRFWIPLVLLCLLAACATSETSGDSAWADEVALSETQPTFLFFYTDG